MIKNVPFAALALAVLTFATSCKKDLNTGGNEFKKRNVKAGYAIAAALPVQTVSGVITTNTTWDNSKVWELSGVVLVANTTQSTNSTAPSFGMSQPFFNDGPLNFIGGVKGAFAISTAGYQGWSTL